MLNIVVGNKCNLNCNHCFLSKSYNKPYKQEPRLYEYNIKYDKIDKNNVNRYISIISSNKFRELLVKNNINSISLFSFGDIMMEDKETLTNISFLVSKLKSLYPSLNIKLQTNFVYHVTEEMETLLNKVDTIRTSFDIQTRFRTINDIILWYSNIKHWSKIKPIKLEIVATSPLIQRRKKLIRVLKKLIDKKLIDTFYVYPITSIGNARHGRLIPSDTDLFIQLLKDLMSLDVKSNTIIDALVNKEYYKSFDIYAVPIPILSLNNDTLIDNIYYNSKEERFVIGNNIESYAINDKCLICPFYSKCGGYYKTDTVDENYCPFLNNFMDEYNDTTLYDIALEKYLERNDINE